MVRGRTIRASFACSSPRISTLIARGRLPSALVVQSVDLRWSRHGSLESNPLTWKFLYLVGPQFLTQGMLNSNFGRPPHKLIFWVLLQTEQFVLMVLLALAPIKWKRAAKGGVLLHSLIVVIYTFWCCTVKKRQNEFRKKFLEGVLECWKLLDLKTIQGNIFSYFDQK